MQKKTILTLSVLGLIGSSSISRSEEFVVTAQKIEDPKVVFATIESVDEVAARARIGGTIITMDVKEGDIVTAGQEIAVVGDQKLALQAEALNAQISSLESQSEKSNADLKRVQFLIGGGGVSRAELDSAKAAASTAANDLKAKRAQRELIAQEVTEGKILAPSYGRVLRVPVTAGSVVMPGETVATIAAEDYILRLSIPERHAAFLKKGDKIRLEEGDMAQGHVRDGEISLVYPAIENGRVTADATVKGLNNYFVGERVRVWVNTAQRMGYLIPADYITRKSGIDYVHLKGEGGQSYEIPVQCGRSDSSDGRTREVISGLRDQDILLRP